MDSSVPNISEYIKSRSYSLETFTQFAQFANLQPLLSFKELLTHWYLSNLIEESKPFSELLFNDLPKDIFLKNYFYCFPFIDKTKRLDTALYIKKTSSPNDEVSILNLVEIFKSMPIFPFQFENIPFTVNQFRLNGHTSSMPDFPNLPFFHKTPSHNIILHISFILDIIFSSLEEYLNINNRSYSAQKQLNNLSKLLNLDNYFKDIHSNPCFCLTKTLPLKLGKKIEKESTLLQKIFDTIYSILKTYLENEPSSSNSIIPLKTLFYLYVVNKHYHIVDILLKCNPASSSISSSNLESSFLLTNIYCSFYAKDESHLFYENMNSVLCNWKNDFLSLTNRCNILDPLNINDFFEKLASIDSIKAYLLAQPCFELVQEKFESSVYCNSANRFFKNLLANEYSSDIDKLFVFRKSTLNHMENPFLNLDFDYNLSKEDMNHTYWGCILKYFDMEKILNLTNISKDTLALIAMLSDDTLPDILTLAENRYKKDSSDKILKTFCHFYENTPIPLFFKIYSLFAGDRSSQKISKLNYTTLIKFFTDCCSFSCKNIDSIDADNTIDNYRLFRSACSSTQQKSCFQEFQKRLNDLSASIHS